MKKDALFFAALALGGVGLYLWLKGRPASAPGVVGTTGTARTDPNLLTQFAGLFGRGQASTVRGPSGNADSSVISAAVGPLASLAKAAIDAIFRTGQSNNPTGRAPGLPDPGAYPGLYPQADSGYYGQPGYQVTPPGAIPEGRNFGLDDPIDNSYNAASSDDIWWESEGLFAE